MRYPCLNGEMIPKKSPTGISPCLECWGPTAQVSGTISVRFIILEARGALLHASGQTAVLQSFQGGDVTSLESAGKG